MNNNTEWAFVDLENIGSLTNISIEKYDVVYVFVGSKQSNVSLTPESIEKFVELKILRIKETSKDNLDFHLSYYLGKFDSSAKKDVTFTIISNDSGFDNLIKHISSTGRKCKRLRFEIKESLSTTVLQNLLAKGPEKMPKTEKSLKNYIKSHLGSNNSKKKIEKTFSYVIKNKKVANRINVLQSN